MIPSAYSPSLTDQDIPKWKKDLLDKRKTASRTIMSSDGTVRLRVTRPKSIGSSSQLFSNYNKETRRSSIPLNMYTGQQLQTYPLDVKKTTRESVTSRKESSDSYKSEYGVVNKVNIKLKINDEEYHSDSSDEIFKPGLVSVRKNKYLTKCMSSPAAINLEKKPINLEQIQKLDPSKLKPEYEYNRKPCHIKVNQYQAKYLEVVQSTTSIPNGKSTSENKTSVNSNNFLNHTITSDDKYVPTTNLVKQTAKIFETPQKKLEPKISHKVRSIVVSFSNNMNNRNDVNYEQKNTSVKPSLSPKPYFLKKEYLIPTKYAPAAESCM